MDIPFDKDIRVLTFLCYAEDRASHVHSAGTIACSAGIETAWGALRLCPTRVYPEARPYPVMVVLTGRHLHERRRDVLTKGTAEPQCSKALGGSHSLMHEAGVERAAHRVDEDKGRFLGVVHEDLANSFVVNLQIAITLDVQQYPA